MAGMGSVAMLPMQVDVEGDVEECEADADSVESGAVKEGVEKQREGPLTLAESIKWADVMVQLLGKPDTDLSEVQLVLTTHFSGLGTAECALLQLVDAWAASGAVKLLPPMFWSACDVDSDARDVLMAHDGTGMEHVFGNLLDRIPTHTHCETWNICRVMQEKNSKQSWPQTREKVKQREQSCWRSAARSFLRRLWRPALSVSEPLRV